MSPDAENSRRLVVSGEQLIEMCKNLATKLQEWTGIRGRKVNIYGIPRAGSIVAAQVAAVAPDTIHVVYSIEKADCLVDDIIDTGRTQNIYEERFGKKTYALYGKGKYKNCLTNVTPTQWVAFPWDDHAQNKEHEEFVLRLLQEAGEDASRPGLLDTPVRFLKTWKDLTAGYRTELNLRAFARDDIMEADTKGMIMVKDIEMYSLCEHHLLPFYGKVHVAYLPDKHVFGMSKIPRLVDMFARRLQTQERMGQQICDAIDNVLRPLGVGVVIEANHLCMMMRGAQKQYSKTVTSHVKGALKEDAKAREEFLQLIKA